MPLSLSLKVFVAVAKHSKLANSTVVTNIRASSSVCPLEFVSNLGEMPLQSTLINKDLVATHQAADFDTEIAFQEFLCFYCLSQKVRKV